jgi:hypothetical protein
MCPYLLAEWMSLGIGAALIAMALWGILRLYCPCRRHR